jgi:hypothetical protein
VFSVAQPPPKGFRTPLRPTDHDFEVPSKSFYTKPHSNAPYTMPNPSPFTAYTTPIPSMLVPESPQMPSYTMSVLNFSSTLKKGSRKQKQVTDENANPTFTPEPPPKCAKKAMSTIDQKLEIILQEILNQNWRLGDFLYYLFRWRLPGGAHAHKEFGHALAIEAFLQRGSSTSKEKHSASEIIVAWLTCPWGHVKGDEDEDNGLETETPYHEINPVQRSL